MSFRRRCQFANICLALAGAMLYARSALCQNLQQEASVAVRTLESSLTDLIARVEPAVVAIQRISSPEVRDAGAEGEFAPLFNDHAFSFTPGGEQQSVFSPSGAGVVIDPDGFILTQYLNIRSGDSHFVITPEGKKFEAKITAADPRSGLAVLKIDASGLAALELGEAEGLRKGSFVVAVGNPQAITDDGEPTASWGIIANISQKASPDTNLNNVADNTGQTFATTLHHLGTLLETDARLGWSSGGGALVDLDGKLVGVMTNASTIPGHESAAGYAIPMNGVFRRIVSQLKAGKEVEYGLLGVRLTDMSARGDSSGNGAVAGALIDSPLPGSAAQRAGLERNDLLVEVDGLPVESAADLQLTVGAMPPGKTLKVSYVRGGQIAETEITLSKFFVVGQRVITNGFPHWRGIQVDYATALPNDELMVAAQSAKIDPEGCVVVSDVLKESPAWAAGVRPGMFVSHVDETRVSTPSEFRDAVAQLEDIVNLRFTDSLSPNQAAGLLENPPNPNNLQNKVEREVPQSL